MDCDCNSCRAWNELLEPTRKALAKALDDMKAFAGLEE